ncbi:hypothetical protein J2T57_000136 [Natronocella acetinitrilica]|uniref:RanBP2-type domain-containing protein n=1 Tax=Natronocella acetinitrilica TaxID=414046 RepID=A0AAE3G0E7_9GAMM|nr:DUF2007 domain-containing protein [Natronocella acetinitrilica]MCP1673044.1 hypothetical protein [Natronocella acetinitrilica]
MKCIYSSHSPLLVSHMRNLLEAAGIRCQTRNMGLAGAAGELPPTAIWPELWVEREIDYQRAEQLVEEAQRDPPPGQSWRCPDCGETLEAQFDQCWQCGAERPR